MKLLMVGPIDTQGRYAGGIAQVMNSLIEKNEKFHESDVQVNWFNNFRIPRSQYGNGRMNLENLINAGKIYFDLLKEIKEFQPDVLYYHASVRLGLLKDLLVLSGVRKVKKVVHIHAAELKHILHGNRMLRQFTLYLLKHVPDHIVTLSAKTREELIREGIDQSRISVLYNFHTLAFTEEDLERKIEASQKREGLNLLYLGSLNVQKGIIDLLDSLKAVNAPCHLDIGGLPLDEKMRKTLEDKVDELPSGMVAMHGFVKGEQKEKLLYHADVLILPSYAEGMPMVLLEAIAAGCGIVATAVGAVGEIFDNENGAIIQPGNVQQLSESINAMADGEKRALCMRINYEKSQNFSIDQFIHQIIAICNQTASKPNG